MTHSAEWFARQEALCLEPTRNTERYYYKSGTIKLILSPIALCLAVVPGVLLFISGLKELIKTRKYLAQFLEFEMDCMRNGRTVTFDGPPGSGKTFTAANMAYILAQRRWAELQEDYLTQRTMLAEWMRAGDVDKLSEFKALEESYKFFAVRADKYIPCLISSIPLEEFGSCRRSYVLDPNIFLQIERCPVYTVLMNDESGQLNGNDKSKTDKNEYKDLWRFIRHFFDGMGLNTNQDANQNAIALRRSTDYATHLFGQEWLLAPQRLQKKYEKRKFKYFKKLANNRYTVNEAEAVGQELYYLKKYIHTIGFRRVKYQIFAVGGGAISQIEEYILPAIGCVNYDDRCFRNLYLCKDNEISLQGWEKMTVDEFDRSKYDEQLGAVGNKRAR